MSNIPQKPVDPEVQQRLDIANAAGGTQAAAPPVVAAKPKTVADLTPSELEEQIRAILSSNLRSGAMKPAAPKEPNWAELGELEATNLEADVYIPVIAHEVPNYLQLDMKDPEYVGVWVNRNQIRISQKQAEGYELLKETDLSSTFKVPLKFDSEGMYIYEDVVAMKVHKKILYGKRRQQVSRSVNQLKNLKGLSKENLQQQVISKDPTLDMAFDKGLMSFI